MEKDIRGIIPPVVTIFNADGKVDEARYRNHIEFLANKVHGLFVCGTYGAGPAMTLEERKRVTEIAIDQVNGRKKYNLCLINCRGYSSKGRKMAEK